MSVDSYKIIKELGRGTFGVTFLGVDTINQRNVAIKTIDINKSRELGADINAINSEIDVLRNLGGQSCSKYIACFYESFQGELDGIPTIFIVSEYISGGSLTDFIRQNIEMMTPSILWPLILQLLLGLKYIHESGYAHRDIKPDNILITEDYNIKYIDFGLSCLEKCRGNVCSTNCNGSPGTYVYMPPETYNGTKEESLRGSQAHDIWSLGVVIFQLCQGINSFPFQVLSIDNRNLLPRDEIIAHILRSPEYYPNYKLDDGRTNQFIINILINNWTERPDINRLIYIFIDLVLSKIWL